MDTVPLGIVMDNIYGVLVGLVLVLTTAIVTACLFFKKYMERPSEKGARRYLTGRQSSSNYGPVPECSTTRHRTAQSVEYLVQKGSPDDQLQNFCKKVIGKLKPNSSRQFAVLILCEDSDLQRPHKFCNWYKVAKPGWLENLFRHAEIKLMQKFDALWDAYYAAKKSDPEYVILYTRKSPCSKCTRRVIENFKNIPMHTCVVYTEDWGKKSPKTNEKYRKELRDNDIEVKQIEI